MHALHIFALPQAPSFRALPLSCSILKGSSCIFPRHRLGIWQPTRRGEKRHAHMCLKAPPVIVPGQSWLAPDFLWLKLGGSSPTSQNPKSSYTTSPATTLPVLGTIVDFLLGAEEQTPLQTSAYFDSLPPQRRPLGKNNTGTLESHKFSEQVELAAAHDCKLRRWPEAGLVDQDSLRM